jgi:uncharacterized protein (DUF362 family)
MQPTVILRRCPDYNTARIHQLVREGLEEFGLRPWGRTLVKPNLVATGKDFPHAYTRPEFTEGVLRALRDRARGDLVELAVGERSGITMPTRYAYRGANYYAMARRVGGITMHHFDEVPQVEIPLHHAARLRDHLYTPQPVARADFFVNCPKFKAHPWTTVTFGLKNYIGIQDDPHRLIDHDHALDRKVVDLQYVLQPDFIAVDAITAGEGRMLTPLPFDLGLVVMGNNQVALDAVCARIIGLDPDTIPHIRLTREAGFGPTELSKIRITGDLTLPTARKAASGFRSGLIRVEEYFKGTSIQAHSGPPPGDQDYCWGGCPGALEEAIELLRLFNRNADEALPPMHIVFGDYRGQIAAKPGEPVLFIGDCASFAGSIAGQPIAVQSVYRPRKEKEPLAARRDDIFVKMARTGWKMRSLKRNQVVRMKGCPVSVAEQLLALVAAGGLPNPYFAPARAIPFVNSYFSWRTHSALRRLRGQTYNQPGPTLRGAARPSQNVETAHQEAGP